MSVTRLTDFVYAFRLLNLIQKPWTEQTAYKLGLIDAEGKTLKKWDAMNSEERDSMSSFVRIAFNLKRVLEKFPAGETRIAKLMVGMRLLRESNDSLDAPFSDEELKFIFEELSKIIEDTPVNQTGDAVSVNTPRPMKRDKIMDLESEDAELHPSAVIRRHHEKIEKAKST